MDEEPGSRLARLDAIQELGALKARYADDDPGTRRLARNRDSLDLDLELRER